MEDICCSQWITLLVLLSPTRGNSKEQYATLSVPLIYIHKAFRIG